jgi:uncharacterized protein (DUF305 family)
MKIDLTQALVGVCILVVGIGVGHSFSGNKETDSNYMMSNSSSMQMEMGAMTTGLQGKEGADFDKVFLNEMIVHHQGAIDMAELALAHAQHQEVKDLAQAIISAQTTEIQKMKEWQTAWFAK